MIGFILISIVLGSTGFIQYNIQQNTKDNVNTVLNSSIDELTSLENMKSRIPRIADLTDEIYEKLVNGEISDEELINERKILNDEIISTKESAEKFFGLTRYSEDEIITAQELQNDVEKFVDTSSIMIESGQKQIRVEETEIEFFAIESEIMTGLDKATSFEIDEVALRQKIMEDSFDVNSQILVVGYVVALGIAAIIVISVNKSIVRSLYKIKNWTEQISQGDFNSKIHVKSDDDFIEVIDSINKVSQKLDDYKEQVIKNERLATIGEVSSRLTHDIRNPLSTIKLAIQYIEHAEKNTDSPSLRKYIPVIKTSLERMTTQIDDVLGYVRTTPLESSKISIKELIVETIKGINIPKRIQIIPIKQDANIICDPQKIKIVLENLIQNSIESIGEESGKILFSIKENDNEIILDVEDTGKGISDSDMSHIFEPLYTTKTNGTGLGLLSCKNIIEQHGGKIFARNSVKGGAIFTLTIPK